MRPGYMSSVYPQFAVPELVTTAQKYGYTGIEFRSEWDHKHGVELDATPAQIAEIKQTLAESGVAASCIATSVKFNSPEPEAHLPHRETLKKYIVLAAQLGAPYIRTFSDGLPEENDQEREKVLSLAAESYASVNDWAAQYGVVVLVETHTNMKGQYAKSILDQAQCSNLEVLWHASHHLKRGQTIDEAYSFIKGHVRHLHFGVSQVNGVLTFEDNRRMFELLKADAFGGFFSVEVINPEDPAGVLQAHIDEYNKLIAAV